MSFSQEIKDFLGAYNTSYKNSSDASLKAAQMDYTRKRTEKLDDPTDNEVKKAHANSLNAQADYYRTRPRGDPLESSRRQALDLQNEGTRLHNDAFRRANQPPEDDGLVNSVRQGSTPAPTATPIPTPQSAIPTNATQTSYTEGEDDDAPTQASVASTPSDGDTAAADDSEAEPEDHAATASQAYAAAFKYNTQGGATRSAIPSAGGAAGGQRGLQNFYAGGGALDPKQFRELTDAVDPDKKMGESERNITALSKAYNFYMGRNEVGKAQKVASDIVQHMRVASGRYGHLAAAAAGEGDIDTAIKAAQKAYSYIPDGNDMKLTKGEDGKISYTQTGPDGKTISKGIMTPQELGAAAMGVSAGGFDKFIMNAAGMREAAASGKGAGGALPTLADRKRGDEIAGVALDNKTPEGKDLFDIPAADRPMVKNIATHILSDKRNGLNGEDAIRVAGELTKASTEKPTYKVRLGEDGGAEVKLADGRTVNLTKPAFEEIVAAQGKSKVKMAANMKAESEKKASEEKRAGAIKARSDYIQGEVEKKTTEADDRNLRSRGRVRRPRGAIIMPEEPPYAGHGE